MSSPRQVAARPGEGAHDHPLDEPCPIPHGGVLRVSGRAWGSQGEPRSHAYRAYGPDTRQARRGAGQRTRRTRRSSSRHPAAVWGAGDTAGGDRGAVLRTRCPLHRAPHHHPGGVDGGPQRHRSLARQAGAPHPRRGAGGRLAPARRQLAPLVAVAEADLPQLSRRRLRAHLAALEAHPPLWALMLGCAVRRELPLDDDEAERPPSAATVAALARLTALLDEPRPSTPAETRAPCTTPRL